MLAIYLAAAVIAFFVGGAIGVLITVQRMRIGCARLDTDLALAMQRATAAARQHAEVLQTLESSRADLLLLRDELAGNIRELGLLKAHDAQRSTELSAIATKLATTSTDLATAVSERDAARLQLIGQKEAVDEALAHMRATFASLSQEQLKSNATQFLDLATTKFSQFSAQAAGTLDERKSQIEALIKPLHEATSIYQQRLQQIETSRQEGYGALLSQLGSLGEIGRNLERQTTQLVGALRRPTTRGQWGELTLRRLVELAGMSSHCDFSEQVSVETDTGRQRPDMIVRLPSERTIIVDSKASLDKFLDAAEGCDDVQRGVLLTAHAGHVRSRAKELSQKAYWNQFNRSPEFVVMFLPGEAFLYAAIERDPAIIEDAMRDKVIIATPTTLIALFKCVEYGWRQEAMSQNAEEIRVLGKQLHERIVTVLNKLSSLGSKLNGAVEAFNDLNRSVDTRLSVTARKLNELGARSDKEMPEIAAIDLSARRAANPEFLAQLAPADPVEAAS